jgi:carbamoyl-phosphate synthase large subunit
VLNVIERETDGNADLLEGVVVQFGGQTPLKLAAALEAAGVPILGTSTDAIDRAEERGRFGAMLAQLDIPYPAGGTASSLEEAKGVAKRIGYPVVVRPSYVLGGRAMAIIYSEPLLERYMGEAFKAAAGQTVLIDQYLEDAYEVDVDAIGDGENVVIGGVLQHIEEAGVHSGDSAMVMPPYKVSLWHLNAIRDYTEQIGRELGVVGLMNIQFAVKDDVVYVLEVNPRASRTVPFVSKATGVPLAKLATRVALGERLADIGLVEEPPVEGFFVKEVVIPLDKFPGADAALGPEMRSTGEVMGHAGRFGHAFAKAQIGAGNAIPAEGTVLVSVNDFDKSAALKLARDMQRMGLAIIATRGTANFFIGAGLRDVATVNKVSEGTPNVVDYISEGRIDLIISTPLGQTARDDGQLIRRAAIRHKVPLLTTLSAAQAAVGAIRATRERAFRVRSLQAHHNV